MKQIPTHELIRELKTRASDWNLDQRQDRSLDDMFATDEHAVSRLEHACGKAYTAMMTTIEGRYERN